MSQKADGFFSWLWQGGPGWPVLLGLPLLPSLLGYWSSSHLAYTTHGLGPWMVLVGFLLVLLALPRQNPVQNVPGGLALALSAFAVWTQGAGFSAWALFFGLSGLLIWRHSQPGIDPTRTGSAILALAVLLLPILDSGLVVGMRLLSLWVVDRLLELMQVDFSRVGISYFLGDTQFAIWQRCSGASSTRVFFLLLSLGYLWVGKARRIWWLAPIQAAFLGLSCNVLRISSHLLLSLWRGQALGTGTHEALGIVFFLLLLPLVGWWVISSTSWSGAVPLPDFQTPGRRRKNSGWLTFWGVLVGFSWFFLGIPPLEKQLEHSYQVSWNRRLEKVHANRFVESPGGGGWILLEHPLEACLALKGWDIDATRTRFNRQGETIRLESRFRVGEKQLENRWQAALWIWIHPSLWGEPLHAELRLVEPGVLSRPLAERSSDARGRSGRAGPESKNSLETD